MFVCLVDVAGHVFHGTDMIRVLGKFPADFQTFFLPRKRTLNTETEKTIETI